MMGARSGRYFGEEIGGIMGFGLVWKEVHTRLEGTERDGRAQWEDRGFT